MKTILKYSLGIALLAMPFTACKHEKTVEQPRRIIEEQDPATGVMALREYSFSDTITIGGKCYKYTCSLEKTDTAQVLVNPQGVEYYESRVHISVHQGETTIFDKKFYKKNFRDMVPVNFLKTSTMVGVNYNVTKRDDDRSALYFIVTVGDPDETSDMVYPLELKVATDGSFSMKKAENLETEPLNPNLNVDPSEDAI